ncbi:MAG: MarR family winged helix-turn-helix transcriptional regulator [Halieaceae bacterium]
MSASEVIKLEEFLPYRLSILSNTVSNAIADGYRGRFDLSIPDWRVMAVLARFPGSSAQDLVEWTQMDKVAVSRGVSRLLQRGLLLKNTADADRRRSELRLSAEGEAIYGKIIPLARAYESQLLAAISSEHRDLLAEILADLQQAAEGLSEPLER